MISWRLVTPTGFRGQRCHLVETMQRGRVLPRRVARARDVWEARAGTW